MANNDLIDRQKYPELDLILWDRAERFVEPETAFKQYEIRWKYIDQARITDEEKALVRRLIDEFGQGLFMGS